MQILVIGATGMIGSRVVAEALRRGHRVTGATRSGADGTKVVQASDPKAVAELAKGHDAVVMAVSPPRDGSEPVGPFLADGRGVLTGTHDARVGRLVIVGGAGSLEVAPGLPLMDTPDFPPAYRGEALAQAALLDEVRKETNLDWTYLSPAPEIGPGERTGAYRLGGDQLMTGASGKSFISAEDYAVALVDILEKDLGVRQRVSVVG
ncbi:NAD(P)H-binding protein [Nonomuraea sp. NPDC050310]|uniref:NAD(P)-dependent oxidoreductase n=1 Tax=unclassified Nonomuraea TaxID=2593643 RepID=UPI0033DB50AB